MSTKGSSPLSLAKQFYAASMRAIGRGLIASGLAKDTAPPVEQRWRHWAYSLTKVYDSLAMAELDVPWWTYDAIIAVDTWLSGRGRPIRVYEYGSGASTVWLSRRADEIHSVEHHRGFGEMMQRELAHDPRIDLRVIEPVESHDPAVPSQKEGHQGLDFSAYVSSIDDVDGEFDLVVIDGRAREACLGKAKDRLAPGGIVVYDNSRRKRYQQAIATCGLTEKVYAGLTPTLPYPERTSVLTK